MTIAVAAHERSPELPDELRGHVGPEFDDPLARPWTIPTAVGVAVVLA